MVKHRWWALLGGGFAALFILTATANADPVKKATAVAVYQPIEIPGMVLLPGNYVVKIPDPVTHPDMVGFFNQDESQLIKLVRTIPKYRLEVTDKTVITFEEGAKGAPDLIKSWFYPDEYWGREFVYGKAKTLLTAEEAPVFEPTLVPEEAAPAAVIEESPEATTEIAAEAAPEPVLAAEPTPEFAEGFPLPIEELPKTATPLPLIAVLGLCAIALGVALRRLPSSIR